MSLLNLVLNDSKLESLSGSSFEAKANGSGGGRGGVGGVGVGGGVGGVTGCLLSGRKVARRGCQTKLELLFEFEFEFGLVFVFVFVIDERGFLKRSISSGGFPDRLSALPVVDSKNLI